MNSIIYVVLFVLPYVYSARILGVFPFPSYSHHQLSNAIFTELANKGHNVTVITPYKGKNPSENFRQILVNDFLEKSKGWYDLLNYLNNFKIVDVKDNLYDQINFNVLHKIVWLEKVGIAFTELTLSHPNVQTFLDENQQFDLVIVQHFLSDAYNGFCYHYNAPCISLCPMIAPAWINRKVGNPGSPSHVPQLYVDYTADMNFFQRFYNTFVYILIEISHHIHLYPKQNELLKKYFPNAPHLDELYYNVSLILVNSHVSINDVAPTLPNIIHVAGAHVKEPHPLPSDLQEYLDNAKDGVIFFSMGSNLKSKDLCTQKRNAILNVFSKLKQKVLWKWEDESMPNKTENVKIATWLPQQDILAHPNVVLFITHGGLMSTIEAVYNGVPVFGIPVFSDQGLNMKRAELAGYGKCVFYRDINENTFGNALSEMLSNNRFKENALMRSRIMRDQVVKPLDNAVFWIEYILRHRGAPHLRSAAVNLAWYKYHLLDVIGSAFIIFMVILCVIGLPIIYTRRLSNTKQSKQSKKKRQ